MLTDVNQQEEIIQNKAFNMHKKSFANTTRNINNIPISSTECQKLIDHQFDWKSANIKWK